ncbi:MAG: DNA-directed RNA polymerase subunit H [Candidatus Nanohaloarchaeota archaeon QJJ-7]|nr:DNA-directed RNA polymerase subunit H [Candidatus Nanohaloarchaeota archaeon QJJ-7]
MDVEEHELVPDHEVMDEGEVEELLEEYEITKDELPTIHHNDSALKPVDSEPGDVIRIERSSPTAGETTYYRRVVEE